MKNNILFIFLSIVFIGLSTTSCEKVVELNLNSIEPRLVIDAAIGDNLPCTVTLTKTQDVYDTSAPLTVSGASITLTNEDGQTENLKELKPGIYQSDILGIAKKSYTLKVTLDNKSYQASATIPQAVPIDSIYMLNINFGRSSVLSPVAIYRDPAGIANFYYTLLWVNNRRMRTIYLNNDEFQDGKIINDVLFFNNEDNNKEDLKIGDTIKVDLQSINEGAYTYFSTIFAFGAAGSANPKSNFSGDVLGCFRAFNSNMKEIIITQDRIVDR